MTNASSLTLGDLLYADQTRSRVSEADWQALILAIVSGSRPALHVLFQRAHRMVFTLAFRLTGSPRAAEALTVEVFHDVWQEAAGYQASGGTVVGWIMNLARSRALQHIGLKGRSGQAEARSVQLRAALQGLDDDEREVIEEAFFNERTCADVASRLRLPEAAVIDRLNSGFDKLQQALAGREASS